MASASVALGATSACVARPVLPAERAVSFGFENSVTDTPRWEHYAHQLRRVNATSLSLSVGRTDWTAFNWAARPQASADGVAGSGRDYVAEAIDALRPELTGNSEITLTIDTLCPANIAADPRIAGVNPQGELSNDFPSVSSLESGIAGDLLVQLAGDICARYKPNRISLTELMFDDYTFGTPDLRSFIKHSGKKDWPRTSTGDIHAAHPSLGIWRSAALATLLTRIRTAAQAHGVLLDMDVRASWTNPDGDRAASGHAYEALLLAADRLVIWNYFSINASTPEYAGLLARSLQQRLPGRFVMSTGFWAQNSPLAPEQLSAALQAISDAGPVAVSVTPVSLMAQEHWDVLARAWKI
ncbi:hypothetical protein [Glutamicibacter sp.]|uniref:hypothetical protein n=1 Tax=Glutamicibacter sp. TaxID=1931995 RepID=UPI002FDB35F0